MIGAVNLANITFRSCLYSTNNLRNISTYADPLYFQVTKVFFGEPLKKKKKLDPGILRAREERKRRKIQKRIRQLEKISNYPKPIFEIDQLPKLLQNEKRSCHLTTPLSEEEIERRKLIQQEWSDYKRKQWLKDVCIMKSIMISQETALKELKAASKELYKRAVEFDDSYLPYNVNGPMNTPPISNYDTPNGEYKDITVKYAGE